MNWKAIAVLLLLCAGLGLYMLANNRSRQAAQAKKPSYNLLKIDPAQVERLRVTFLDTTYYVRRKAAEWEMLEPFAGYLADSMLVNHFLETLNNISVRQMIPVDSIDLSQVHLDRPVLSFTLFMANGDSSSVRFGILNTMTDNIYARRGTENKVLLIARAIGPVLRINSLMIRGKGLISLHPYQVSRIRYSAPGRPDLAVVRDDKSGDWWIRGGSRDILADERRIMDLLSDIYGGQVREFKPVTAAQDKETGLSKPVRRLWLAGDSGDSAVVALGQSEKALKYLRWAASNLYPGELLLVDSALVSRLDILSGDRLASLQMTHFHPAAVDRIKLMTPTDSIELVEQNDTTWQIVRPEKTPCKLWQVERLLIHTDTVEALKALPPGSERGFDHPQLSLTMYGGDSVLACLMIGDFAGQKQVYMRDGLRNKEYLAASSQLDRLNYSFKDLADVPVRHIVR